MELAHAVIASPLVIWTRGTGRNLAKKEIATLRRRGFDVGRTCRIAENGMVYRGDSPLNIVIAHSDRELTPLLDTARFNYQVYYL